jgi:hypothetical protein
MVVIEFDGIYQNSEVWINGQYLGERPYFPPRLQRRRHRADQEDLV